jgi:hypothetical protein
VERQVHKSHYTVKYASCQVFFFIFMLNPCKQLNLFLFMRTLKPIVHLNIGKLRPITHLNIGKNKKN